MLWWRAGTWILSRRNRLRLNRCSGLRTWSVFLRRCRTGCGRRCIPEQDGETPGAIQSALNQQGMGHVEELRVMLEMLAGGLHRVHYVRGGKLCAMVAGHADQQTFDQCELGGEERELAGEGSG